MKYLRYTGEFVSRSGIIWRVDIMQEADAAFDTVGSLEFPADTPLVIEWQREDKEKVVIGSNATLKIISPGDRTYEDLYTIEVGRIRMDVYKSNKLYWSGALDPEFYEEPYEMANGYEVSLTFSDFGILDRIKYDLSGIQTIRDIITYALQRAVILYNGLKTDYITTTFTDGASITGGGISVRSENFVDEDGEASTLAEVIEGILQPLALRMIQRSGKIYVYDLNGLYNKASVKQIVWDGDSQTLGTDKVYNNAKITWSTYAQSGNLLPDECWGDIETDATLTALNNLDGITKGEAKYFSYHYGTSLSDWDNTDSGFTLWTTKRGNNIELGGNTQFFKIVPQYDGTESTGLAVYWKSASGGRVQIGPNRYENRFFTKEFGNISLRGNSFDSVGELLFKTNKIWIPPVDNSQKLVLRLRIDMLLDPRFNPFESATNLKQGAEQKDWYDQFNNYGNFIYLPVTVKFQPDGSDTVYIWTNKSTVLQSISVPVLVLNSLRVSTYGKWVESSNSDSPDNWGYLCYYDAKDRVDTSGVLGWKYNRPAINPHKEKLSSILENAEAGQYMPYPNYGGTGGKLWVEVRQGWYIVNEGTNLKDSENGPKGLWDKISWVLMKMPEIEVMNNTQFDQAIDTSDVEYNAEINAAAKEPIEIDTICGTSVDGVPMARGAYFNAADGNQIKQLTRAGRTTQVEDLLIGTLYSQFGQRHTTLSGEAQIAYDPMAVYKEDNQGDKRFILTEDVQDARMDTSEATFVELRPDEYTRKD